MPLIEEHCPEPRPAGLADKRRRARLSLAATYDWAVDELGPDPEFADHRKYHFVEALTLPTESLPDDIPASSATDRGPRFVPGTG